MRNFLLGLFLSTLAVAGASSAIGADKFTLGFGADVLVPTADWKKVVSTGFGGSIRLQYNVASFFGIGIASGYYTWNAKDSSGQGVYPNYSGIPLRALCRLYVLPQGGTRLYVSAEAGAFFRKTSDVTIRQPGFTLPGVGTFPDTTITIKGETRTEFAYAPTIGFEFPLAEGKTLIDISIRFDAISLRGGSVATASNFGLRAGVDFGL